MCYARILVTSKMKDYSRRLFIPCRTPLTGTESVALVSWRADASPDCAVRPDRRRLGATALTLIVSSLLLSPFRPPQRTPCAASSPVWLSGDCCCAKLEKPAEPSGPFLWVLKKSQAHALRTLRTVAWRPEDPWLAHLVSLGKVETDQKQMSHSPLWQEYEKLL